MINDVTRISLYRNRKLNRYRHIAFNRHKNTMSEMVSPRRFRRRSLFDSKLTHCKSGEGDGRAFK